MSKDKPQERGDHNTTDTSATGARSGGSNDVSYGRVPDALPSGKGGTRTANTVITGPTPMELQANGYPSGHVFNCMGFNMEAAHCFIFDDMITGPNILCRLDERRVEHIVSVACKPGGGGRGVSVAELSECNFKLLVYFIKKLHKTSRPI